MELIYILTYDCNLRCKYCDIDKRIDNMSRYIIDQSFKFFEKNGISFDKIKFFWWEPLLQINNIKYIVNELSNNNATFYITSNSTLVDKSFIYFIKKNNIKVTFSIDWNYKTTSLNRVLKNGSSISNNIINNTKQYSSNIRVNQVITWETSKLFFDNFIYIYNLWVRDFNFLPAYYKEWSKDWLKNLKDGFAEILNFYKNWGNFRLVNIENYSETSFFNIWLVIDTDWSLYLTNLILSWEFEKYKSELKVWNINTWFIFDINNKNNISMYIKKLNNIIIKSYSKNILNSVKYVDLILNNFCYEYKNIKK